MPNDLSCHACYGTGYPGDIPPHSIAAQEEHTDRYIFDDGDASYMSEFVTKKAANGYKLHTYFPVYDSKEDEFRIFVVMEKI
jgi:hypothetical protein